jgi:hypothetical protein
MLEFIGGIIEKLGEFLLKEEFDKRNPQGCRALFEVYWNLDSVIKHSKKLYKNLEEYASAMNVEDDCRLNNRVELIFVDITRLTRASADFMEWVSRYGYAIAIHNPDLARELGRIVWEKGNYLSAFSEELAHFDVVPPRSMKKQLKDFRIDFFRFDGAKRWQWGLSDAWTKPFETMERCEGVQTKTIDFTRKEDVAHLITQSKRNTEVFENTAERLRLFIQSNCTLNDLFN